jgi:methylated-DNA-protein-cysteine methyltransferase-like protein
MSKSPFFARIKADVLKIAAAVPEGRVVTFTDIGQHLDVVPRHVAYILATLTPEERAAVPWHRVIAASGQLGRRQFDAEGISQAEILNAEGIELDERERLTDLETLVVPVSALHSGVSKQKRPADAPKPAPGRSAARPRR